MRAMRLMWVFFVKDSRSLLRERNQMLAMLLGLTMAAGGVGMGVWGAHQDSKGRGRATTQEAATTPARLDAAQEMKQGAGTAVKWAMIGLAAGSGFFGTMFFGATQALSVFAGERDERTMELLLASPLSDGALFGLKVGAVMLPAVVASYGLMGAVWAVGGWLAPLEGVVLPMGAVRAGMGWALPVPAVVAVLLVGMCVVASVKAETVKGAGQMLGMIIMMLYIVPMAGMFVVRQFGVSEWVSAAGRWWLSVPFAGQYAMVMSVPAGLGVALLGLGRWGFSRERMVR